MAQGAIKMWIPQDNNIYNPGYTTKPDYSTTSVNLWWK